MEAEFNVRGNKKMKPRCICHFISVFLYLPQVNLYSDPPKPGHLVQSGLNRDSSPVLTLDFTRPQRAEFSSASLHPNGPGNNQSKCVLFHTVKFITLLHHMYVSRPALQMYYCTMTQCHRRVRKLLENLEKSWLFTGLEKTWKK